MKKLTVPEFHAHRSIIGRQTPPLPERYNWEPLHNAHDEPVVYESGVDFDVKPPTFLRDVREMITLLGLDSIIAASRCRDDSDNIVVGPRTTPKRTRKNKTTTEADDTQPEPEAADNPDLTIDYEADDDDGDN